MIRIEAYQAEHHRTLWNAFVAQSPNATFLFNRHYMDYHADRFQDASLLFFDESKLRAIFPACAQGATLSSHAGLSYGGLLKAPDVGAAEMLKILEKLCRHATERGFRKIAYKPTPHIYHRTPSEEDRYALFRQNAALVRVDSSSAVRLPASRPMQERRRRGRRKADARGLRAEETGEEADWSAFWQILRDNLREKHSANPVHTCTEILGLARSFPEEIRLYVIRNTSREVVAGCVVYETATVAHAQYIASSPDGRNQGALDLLFCWLIEDCYATTKRWFDFGISTEEQGQILNAGLADFKEGFGASTVCYEHFQIDFPVTMPEPSPREESICHSNTSD